MTHQIDVVGWSCTVDGLYIRSSSHVCWVRTVIYGSQKAQCEINSEDTPQMRVPILCLFSFHCMLVLVMNLVLLCLLLSSVLSPFDPVCIGGESALVAIVI